jgi:glutaredoxin 3
VSVVFPTKTAHAALVAAALACFAALGCGNPVQAGSAGSEPGKPTDTSGSTAANAKGEPVKPPFAVTGDVDGLLLVWFDAQGVHSAQKRSEIPEASRAQVRIDSLATPPEQRLDPDHVYVADLRAADGSGSYPVKKVSRDAFDAQVDHAKPPPQVDAVASAGVVIYGASWCGVCRSAKAFFKERHVAFVEKDVEKDPGAQTEMLDKTRKKGLTPTGVPVIDFRGEIMLGFDQERLDQLIDRHAKAI